MQIQDTIGDQDSRTFTSILQPQEGERRRVLCVSLRESLKDDDSRWLLSRFYDVQDTSFRWRQVAIDESAFVDDGEALSMFQDRAVEAELQGGADPKLSIVSRPKGIEDAKDALAYLRCHLQRLSSKSSSPYNCYTVIDAVYRRLDRQPLTETDVKVLRGLCWGQIHGVTVAADGLTAKVHSECDSSD